MPRKKKKKGHGFTPISKKARRMILMGKGEELRAKNLEYSRLYQARKRQDESFREEMRLKQAERRKVQGRREEERKRNAMAMRIKRSGINSKEQVAKPDSPSLGTSSQNSLDEERITRERSDVPSTVASSNSLSHPTPDEFPEKTEKQVKKPGRPKAQMDMDPPPLALTERSQRPLRQVRLAQMKAIPKPKRSKKEIPAIAKLLTLASLQKSGKFCFECFVNGTPSVSSFTCCLDDYYQGSLGHEHKQITSRKSNVPATAIPSRNSLTLPSSAKFQNNIRTHYDKLCYKHTRQQIRAQTAPTGTQIPQSLSKDKPPLAPANPSPDKPPLAPANPSPIQLKTPCQGASNQGTLYKGGITKRKRKAPATKSSAESLNRTTVAELPKTEYDNLYFKKRKQDTIVHPVLTPVPIDAETLVQQHLPEDATSASVKVKKPAQRTKRVLIIAEHHRGVVSTMASFWRNRQFCDASIGNGKAIVKVHKLVLYAVCSSLASLSKSNSENHEFLRVNFPEEVSWEALNAFAVYMYYGILDMDCNILQQLKIIAKKLAMKEFGILCNTCLKNQMPQPTTTTAASSTAASSTSASSTDGPLNRPSMQVPSMTSSPPSLSSTISAPVQSAPSITTQVIDTKPEIPESNLESEVASLTPNMSITTQLIDTKPEIPESIAESEVASLTPNMSITTQLIDTKPEIPESNPESEVASLAANADSFGIYPSVKIEQVGPEDDRYGYPSSNSNQTFTVTDSSSSSSSLTATASITSVPAPQKKFAIPFSETKDVKSESYTNVPLIQTSMQFPSMTSSLPSLSSTISTPIQSAQAITTQVIDVKQENSEAELAQVRKDTAAVSSQESEVASLTPNKSGNATSFVICPSIKTEPVGPEDDKYGHLSSNSNKQTFTSTLPSSSTRSLPPAASISTPSVPASQTEYAIPFSEIKDAISTHNNNEMFLLAYPSSSSSSLTAPTRSNTSVPASQKEFAIPFSETEDVKSTKLKDSHPYESTPVSDLSPVSCIEECSQSSHMTETISIPLGQLSNSSSFNLPAMSDKSVYPVKLFKSVTNNLPS